MNEQDQREQLFERAKHGEISGDEADAEAIRLGLGSLSSRPNPDAFRAEAETHWTLPMAVAWIAYLDLDEVREWSAPYRAECWHWVWQRWRVGFDGPVYEGWHLEQRSKPTLAMLGISAAVDRAEGDKPLAMSIGEATEALWMALREGFFVASGIDTQTDRRVEIPKLEWHELVAVQGKGERDEVRHGLTGNGYAEVLLPASALRGFWRRPAESVERLPPTMRPDGDGYMPLYCAAQWIATEGGRLDFPPNNPSIWRAAFDPLLAAITSDRVRVVGLRASERDIVPGHVFAGIQVDYPFDSAEVEILAGPELYLRSYPYVDEQHWRGGFDDALVHRREDKWTRLMVDKASVRQLWPFHPSDFADQHTGLPGRPGKSKHIIDDELDRRAASGHLEPTLAGQAQALLEWLIKNHPGAPRPTVRVVANNIRARFKQVGNRTK